MTRTFRFSLILAACVILANCRTPPPRITFTEIPPAGAGGPIRTAAFAGRVEGARAGDRIVLFARSGVWYVQPLRDAPYTTVDADGRWRSDVHLGAEYAALLVSEGYRPPERTPVLPDIGGAVRAAATVAGRASALTASVPAKPLQFSGYEWDVRQIWSDRGGSNEYDSANASVDPDGALRLRIAPRAGEWTSAEVSLTRPLGYGTYVFVVRDMSAVDPAAGLALFTWDENGRAENFREMDIEIRRPDAKGPIAAQFVLQPNHLPGNLRRFMVPAGLVSHTMRWEPGVVAFKTLRGNFFERPGALIATHTFTTGVPTPGDERVRLAFYYYRKSPQPPRAAAAVVIERFQYLP